MRFAVIGSPVAHSRSPAMHEAAFRALGLDHTYEKIETTAAELPARVAALRAGELDGLNVTVPHKSAVLSLADEIAPAAAAIGAANTLLRTADGRVVAHNTDAPAIAEELARLRGFDFGTAGGALSIRDPRTFAGTSVLVIGSGGAARAAVFAAGALGAAHVVVRARTEPIGAADVLAAGAASTDHARPVLVFEPLGGAPHAERSDLAAIVQCTTAGMHGGPPGELAAGAVHWDSVPSTCVAYDVVYSTGLTPFLAAAAARGLRHAGGLGMLVTQGALAFTLWLGCPPPRDVMHHAAATPHPP
ncbi:MAG: shikimate dehydrogenase [Labilithrix sp.]|nr:shikimate dehydrogenase [Labilithrix sp.]MCW5815418.1 shikimate dehydrogenase [Labilithrix sp.]